MFDLRELASMITDGRGKSSIDIDLIIGWIQQSLTELELHRIKRGLCLYVAGIE
jgi:hypothetical protein